MRKSSSKKKIPAGKAQIVTLSEAEFARVRSQILRSVISELRLRPGGDLGLHGVHQEQQRELWEVREGIARIPRELWFRRSSDRKPMFICVDSPVRRKASTKGS
jgi:hypothetical protein